VASVEIYSKAFCSYCVTAKRLLQAKQIDFTEYAIDMDPPRRQEMIQRAGGRTTVPQIFIGGRHIGGCSDLLALERDGSLNALLDA
jgi:glutaredoxin 3